MPNEKKPITIKLDVELIEKIDKFANEMNISRTGAISVLCNQSIIQNELLKQMSKQ